MRPEHDDVVSVDEEKDGVNKLLPWDRDSLIEFRQISVRTTDTSSAARLPTVSFTGLEVRGPLSDKAGKKESVGACADVPEPRSLFEKRSMRAASDALGLPAGSSSNAIDKAVKEKIVLLGDEDFQVRQDAKRVLGKAGLPALKELAVALATTTDPEIKRNVFRLIDKNLDFSKDSREWLELRRSTLQMLKEDQEKSNPPGLPNAEDKYMDSMRRLLNVDSKKFVSKENRDGISFAKNLLALAQKEVGPTGDKKTFEKLNGLLEQDKRVGTQAEYLLVDARISFAQKVAGTYPKEALHQLTEALKSSYDSPGEYIDEVYIAAGTALNRVDKQTREKWIKDAPQYKLDIKLLEKELGRK